jgi:hypothetical protein
MEIDRGEICLVKKNIETHSNEHEYMTNGW